MSMWRRGAFAFLVVAGIIALSVKPGGAQQDVRGQVEVFVETSGTLPFPGEMVLLRIRSTFPARPIALEWLEQPALTNFAWMQLGPDRSFKTELNGAPVVGFERRIALFPEKNGRLRIEPFVHHLTVIDADNARRQVDLRSAPVDLEVGAWPAAQGGPYARHSWWLPAKSLTVSDKWEPNPDQLAPGETARRTVTIEAAGISVERLPPAPKLRSPGVITFAAPVERLTVVTPDGPVARAVYRWDVRPATAIAATLEAVHIPWFDTGSRQMRDAVLPARRVALVDESASRSMTATPSAGDDRLFARSAWSGAVAFAVGLAILFGRRGSERRSLRRLLRNVGERRELAVLRKAAQSGDPNAFRAAVYELARRDWGRARQWLADPSAAAGVGALDRHLFGPTDGAQPNIATLAKTITRAWRRSGGGGPRTEPHIAPLDGPRPSSLQP